MSSDYVTPLYRKYEPYVVTASKKCLKYVPLKILTMGNAETASCVYLKLRKPYEDFPNDVRVRSDAAIVAQAVFKVARHYRYLQIFDRGIPKIRIDFVENLEPIGLEVEIADIRHAIEAEEHAHNLKTSNCMCEILTVLVFFFGTAALVYFTTPVTQRFALL
jgi:hypothetical protein